MGFSSVIVRFNNSIMFSNVAKHKLGKVKDERVHASHPVCMVDLEHLEGDSNLPCDKN